MSTGMVVLGLLAERPDNGYRLERRLNERLSSARFERGAAQHALKRLSMRGYVRCVEEEYRATASGVERFESWLRSATAMPPERDELMARLALCRPGDMPHLIEVLREAELACTARLEDLNARTREQERSADLQDWEAHMSVAAIAGTAAWWDARIKWLGDLRAGLQRAWLGYEAEQRGAAPPRTRR
jgi:DNA-binding PadR family transcriptional regulator